MTNAPELPKPRAERLASLDALRERLTARGTETREELEKRMAQASSEIAQSDFYRYRIINDDLDVAYEELVAVMREIARS